MICTNKSITYLLLALGLLREASTSPIPTGAQEQEGEKGKEVNTTLTNNYVEMDVMRFPDDIKLNSPPSWLLSWEDAEFGIIGEKFPEPFGANHSNENLRTAYWVAAMTGGQWLSEEQIQKTLAKRADDGEAIDEVQIDELVLEYMASGNQLVLAPLTNNNEEEVDVQKRTWAQFQAGRWIRSASHVARWWALGALSDGLQGACDWMSLGRSAVCSRAGDGSTACVSWTGGWKDLPRCVARAALDSIQSDFGYYNDLSGRCPKCMGESWRKRELVDSAKEFQLDARGSSNEQMCVSNRPDGC